MFIDSVYWIALRYPRDKWHYKAKGITQYISKLPNIYITEAIITETVNFLLRKSTHFIAHETMQHLLHSMRIKLIENTTETRIATLDLMQKYPVLSFTDANIVYHMQKNKLEQIISFDKGFDQVQNITRVHLREQFTDE